MPLTRNQASAAAQSRTDGAESAEASMSKETADQGGTSSESDPPRRDSPENCSICLGPFTNKSFTSSCAHSFCFVCLKQWSKVKAECPLCKQPFTSIFHNIRSNQMYEIYELPRQPPNQVNQYNIYADYGLTAFAAPTHHYLSLSQPFDADLTLSNFSRFQFRHRRYDRYLNPLSIQGEHPYSFTSPAVNPTTHVSAASWPRGAENFRHEVYRHNLGPPFVILGNENSTYRLTPVMVAASSHRLHRIMPWLTRELRVLLRSHQNVRLAISMIQPLLTQVSIDSVYFHDRVATLIGRRSRTFIQEFVAFANSALSMQAFDRKAMYRRRDDSVAASSPSSTSSENDVVEITDVSPDPVVASSVVETQAAVSQPLDLRRSGWDSPTPGPSWSNLGSRDTTVQAVPIDRVSVSSESDDPVFIPQLRESDSDHSRPGSDIIFVKYDKPWEERSPINLTSDSEKEPEPERVKKKKKSKHKKKRKELSERNESVRKDKGHKTSKGKSHSKEKSKSSSKVDSGEEKGASRHKRPHSSSSPDFLQRKKRKKSKDKREKEAISDRELVDRLFAEAFSQQQKANSHVTTLDEKTGDSPKSGRDKERSGRSSTKDRSKKKKKSKNHSRDSCSPSYSHSFKKHHSGHKKSSNAARLSQTSSAERNHLHRKDPSMEGEKGSVPPSRSSRRDSIDFDRDPLSQAHSSTSASHPAAPGFQPSYLPMPDTVQHIPVNLWVSTWPALPVSHTYHTTHPPPPSSNVPGSSHSVPQNPSPPFPPVASSQNTQGPSTSALDSHTISSDLSTDSDSDDVQDRQIPSLKNVDSRTMHWLETHCPDLGRLQPSSLQPGSSSVTGANAASVSSTSASSSSSSSCDTAVSNVTKQPQESVRQIVDKDNADSNANVEILSVGSGDEDVVICSSTSDSDSDEVHCVEVEQPSAVASSQLNPSSSQLNPSSNQLNHSSSQLNPCAMTSSQLNPCAMTSSQLNPCAMNSSQLNPCAMTSSQPNLCAVTSSQLNPCAVTSSQPNLCAVTSNQHNSRAVTSSSLQLDASPSATNVPDGVEKNASTLPFLPDFSRPVVQASSGSSLFLPSANKPFQPFRLHRKSALSHQGKDPFFPSMSHSSDEDDVNIQKLQCSQTRHSPLKDNMVSSQASEDPIATHAHPLGSTDLVQGIAIPSLSNEQPATPKLSLENAKSGEGSEPWKLGSKGVEQLSQVQASERSQTSFPSSTISTPSSAMFSVLQSLPQISPPVSTVLHSNLNYLPYSSPRTSFSPTSVSSYLLQRFQFGIPPPTATHSPRLPFPPLNSVLTQSHASRLGPPLYPPPGKDAKTSAFVSSGQALPGNSGVGTPSSPQPVTADSCLPSANQVEIPASVGISDVIQNASGLCPEQTLTDSTLQNRFNGSLPPHAVGDSEKDDGLCPMNESEKLDLFGANGFTSDLVAGPAVQGTVGEKMDATSCDEVPSEHATFSILNFHDGTEKVVSYDNRDFLEDPEENTSPDALSERPEVNFPLLIPPDNIVSRLSNAGEANVPDAPSRLDDKNGGSVHTLPLTLGVESKSESLLTCENNEYATMPNGQDSQSVQSLASSISNSSGSADTQIEANFVQHDPADS